MLKLFYMLSLILLISCTKKTHKIETPQEVDSKFKTTYNVSDEELSKVNEQFGNLNLRKYIKTF